MLSLPPLSLYIHFPWCVHKCPYCDFNSHGLKKDLPEKKYIEALLHDLETVIPDIQNRRIQTIYLGGGTPSLFSGDAINDLLSQIGEKIQIETKAEISMEANPESVTLKKLERYKAAGVNRISLGVQSLNDASLKRLGRAHDSIIAHRAIESIVTAGFENFNIDIMYGLPDQTDAAGLKDLRAVLNWRLPHLSWYQLTIEPSTAFFKKPPILPLEETVIALQTEGTLQLMQAGLYPYEISAWSRSESQCRHNVNYWSFGDYIGLGAGAHSKVTVMTDYTVVRTSKWASPYRYLAGDGFQESREKIATTQLPFEFMLNALRYYEPISRALFESRTGLAWTSLTPHLQKAVDKKLITINDDAFVVTEFGRRFYNDLVSLFL